MTFDEFSGGQPIQQDQSQAPQSMSADQFSGGQTLTVTPYDGSQDVGKVSAPLLGFANSINRDATGKATPESMQAMQDQATQAQQTADQANSAGGIAKETALGVSKLGIKFAKSAAVTPIDLVRSMFGKGPMSTANADGSNPIPSIQEDADVNTGKVFEGTMSPLQATEQAVGDTVGGAADVLGAGGLIEKGAAIGSKLAKPVVDALAGATENSIASNAAKNALDVVNPKLTPTETIDALAEGRGQGGGMFSKTTIAPDQRTKDVAKAVQGIVSKSANGAENINNVRTALNTEAENLKNQIKSVDHPYSFKELNSKLSNVEEPISLKGTPFEKQIAPIKQAAMDIAKKNGGTVSSLLDSRKEFDGLVQKTYPNLYDKENAPMRSAITGIRNAMNDFIETNLPKGSGFKDSLRKQSLMYDAIDNIAGKSANETKTTGLGRIAETVKKHPVATALGTGITAYEVGKNVGR